MESLPLIKGILFTFYCLGRLENHPVQSEKNASNYNNVFYYASLILPGHTCTGLTEQCHCKHAFQIGNFNSSLVKRKF